MSGSIVLREKSLLQSSTPQAPATGWTAGSVEPAASGSVPVNTFSQYLLPPRLLSAAQRTQEFIQEAGAQTLWICTIIRACFLRNQWPNSIFQSLEILQNRSKYYVLVASTCLFRVHFLMQSVWGFIWIYVARSLKMFKLRNWDSPVFSSWHWELG